MNKIFRHIPVRLHKFDKTKILEEIQNNIISVLVFNGMTIQGQQFILVV